MPQWINLTALCRAKKLDAKEYILFHSIMFEIRWKHSMVVSIEVRVVVTFGGLGIDKEGA